MLGVVVGNAEVAIRMGLIGGPARIAGVKGFTGREDLGLEGGLA